MTNIEKITTIRLTTKTALKLRSMQKKLSETYDETILRLIKSYEDKNT